MTRATHSYQRVIRLGLTDANREWQKRTGDRIVCLRHAPYITVVRQRKANDDNEETV
jgi:hypothetical protein